MSKEPIAKTLPKHSETKKHFFFLSKISIAQACFLDAMLEATSLRDFCGALGSMKLFGSESQFTQSLEFLLTWDAAARTQVFALRLPQERTWQSLDKHLRHGHTLDSFVAPRRQRRSKERSKSKDRAVQVALAVRASDSPQPGNRTVDMPMIEAVGAGSNACQAVAVLQTYVTFQFCWTGTCQSYDHRLICAGMSQSGSWRALL